MLRRFTVVLIVMLIAAACSDGDEAAQDSGTTTPSPAATTTAPTTTTTTTTAPPTTTEQPAPPAPFSAWIEAVDSAGDCVTLAYVGSGEDVDYGVPPEIVDCNEPHDHQVFFVGEYPAPAGDPYPEEDDLFNVIFDEICIAPLVDATGVGYDEITLSVWGLWPDEEAWRAGERTIACSVANADNPTDGTQMVGRVNPSGAGLPGHLMAAVAEFDQRDIWIYIFGPEGETLDLVNLTNDGSTLVERLTPPSWSPDLTRIAYVAEDAAGQADVYVIDVATGATTQLTDDPANDGGPTFSPDGTKILFSSSRNGDELDLFVMDADGSNVTQLTDDPDRESSGDWSPDGSRIVYRQRSDGQSDIWIMNADGSDQQYFRGGSGNEYDPDWSPDGTRILYISDDTANGEFEILVAPVDGTGATNLTNHPAADEYPEWSPDGEHVVFQSDRHGYTGLFVMRSDGSSQSALVWSFPVGYAQVVLPTG
jgi:hypothetical protein